MEVNEITDKLFSFLNSSPSCFHAADNVKKTLKQNGFEELKENEKWNLKEGGKYFVLRNSSSILSFKIPSAVFKGYLITASHSDSPCLKIKENPEIYSEETVRLNVEKYGGALLTPWFDRPLGIAGRIVTSESKDGEISIDEHLVNISNNPVMIPSLAIHMNRDANEGHKVDIQNEMLPVISSDKDFKFLDFLSKETGIPQDKICSYDLFVYNADSAKTWGADKEFISGPRIDDLECVYSTLEGFINSSNNDFVTVHAVFDNEETGSMSRQGADSTFLRDTLKRINSALGRKKEDYLMAISNSFLISADNAHAVHPAYVSKADPVNRPHLNKGPVIKFNASLKYTSDSLSSAVFKEICKKAEVPYQIYTNNSNIAGGSTLGNISTTQVSIMSVDIGLAQWAMHSPNESAGSRDVEMLIKAIKEFYSSNIKIN